MLTIEQRLKAQLGELLFSVLVNACDIDRLKAENTAKDEEIARLKGDSKPQD